MQSHQASVQLHRANERPNQRMWVIRETDTEGYHAGWNHYNSNSWGLKPVTVTVMLFQ